MQTMSVIGYISVIASLFSAAAIMVIGYYAWKSDVYAQESHKLTGVIKDREDRFQQQVRDLYRAIFISNLIVAGRHDATRDWELALETFNKTFDKVREGERLFRWVPE